MGIKDAMENVLDEERRSELRVGVEMMKAMGKKTPFGQRCVSIGDHDSGAI